MKKSFALIMPILMAMVCHTHSMYANTEATPRNPYMEESQIRKIEIYGVSLQTCYKIPTTIKNLKQRTEYSSTIYNINLLEDLFEDYNSCDEYLTSRDTIVPRRNLCHACVKIYFSFRKVTLYFREDACYYYKGQWYKPNYLLYYSIFCIFEKDSIVYGSILEKCEEEFYNNKTGKTGIENNL